MGEFDMESFAKETAQFIRQAFLRRLTPAQLEKCKTSMEEQLKQIMEIKMEVEAEITRRAEETATQDSEPMEAAVAADNQG